MTKCWWAPACVSKQRRMCSVWSECVCVRVRVSMCVPDRAGSCHVFPVKAAAETVSDQFTLSQEWQGIVWPAGWCAALSSQERMKMRGWGDAEATERCLSNESPDCGVRWLWCSKRPLMTYLMLPGNEHLVKQVGLNTVIQESNLTLLACHV